MCSKSLFEDTGRAAPQPKTSAPQFTVKGSQEHSRTQHWQRCVSKCFIQNLRTVFSSCQHPSVLFLRLLSCTASLFFVNASFKHTHQQARHQQLVTHCATNLASVVVREAQPFSDDTLQRARQLISLHALPQATGSRQPLPRYTTLIYLTFFNLFLFLSVSLYFSPFVLCALIQISSAYNAFKMYPLVKTSGLLV